MSNKNVATKSPGQKSPDAGPIIRVVIGTAGHIDHGKSSLVCRLTGIDPDRLPEEKARGLTIDLGFANFQLSDGSRVGMVDVPGHEKFVHNMVAGATGIDIALLVVAADDSVMPQTLEHLEILQLLGIRRGAIAITKIDMVEPGMVELVADDVRGAVRDTFLQNAPVFPVSSVTGAGVDALRAGLEALAVAATPRPVDAVFRMPVQRVFAARGFGCVLTGIPISGSLTLGDRVEVMPAGLPGVVRGLEAYHHTVDHIEAGHSSAMNLTGVDAAACRRGMQVVAPGYFPPTQYLQVRLQHLARRRKALRDRAVLRLHVGTAEVGATLQFLDRTALNPGETAFVQLKLEEPVVCGAGDRFLVRLPSPPATVGGGVIVDTRNARLRRNRPDVLKLMETALASLGSPKSRVLYELGRAGTVPTKSLDLAVACALSPAELKTVLDPLVAAGEAKTLAGPVYVDRAGFGAARAGADLAAAEYFKKNPDRLVMERLALVKKVNVESVLLDAVLEDLARNGRIELESGGGVRVSEGAARLSELKPELAALRDAVLAKLQQSPFQPPSVSELADALKCPRGSLDAVLKRLHEEKKAVRISPDFYFSMEAVERAKRLIVENCEIHKSKGGEGELDLPSLRDALGTTRRWMIPLVEWFDTSGFTTRLGSRRILKKR